MRYERGCCFYPQYTNGAPVPPLAWSVLRLMQKTADEVELPDIKWKQPADPDVGGQWGLQAHGSGRRFCHIDSVTF